MEVISLLPIELKYKVVDAMTEKQYCSQILHSMSIGYVTARAKRVYGIDLGMCQFDKYEYVDGLCNPLKMKVLLQSNNLDWARKVRVFMAPNPPVVSMVIGFSILLGQLRTKTEMIIGEIVVEDYARSFGIPREYMNRVYASVRMDLD